MTQPLTKILTRQIAPALTAAPMVVPEILATVDVRELLRLPQSKQRDALFGLSRSTWNLLILPCAANNFKPPIKSISLRRPGTQRGCRLIVVASARAYFQRLMDETDRDGTTGHEAEPEETASQSRKPTRPSALPSR